MLHPETLERVEDSVLSVAQTIVYLHAHSAAATGGESGRGSKAGSTSPGRSGVYASVTGATIDSTEAVRVSGQILKAKSKYVLEIEATTIAFVVPSNDNAVATRVTVNGFSDVVQPNAGYNGVEQCDSNYLNCTSHAVLWVDLDAAETAHPGVFIGQPLNIDVYSIVNSGVTTGDVSLRARLHKK